MTTVENTSTSLRRRTMLALAISAIGCAGAAKAQGYADLVDLTIVDRETGQPLQVWRHDGHLFVAGQAGARYSLRVTNHTGGRVLVVMSVDGVNVITGQTAGYGQTGYIFGPYQSYDVSGWRKSDTEVAAFAFTPLPNSYAARTGRPADVGVIGIAAFRERIVAPEPVAPIAEARPEARSASGVSELVVTGQRVPAPAAAAKPSADSAFIAQRADRLGTAHGAREWSVTTRVAFERATAYPELIRRIEYDSRENLIALGVIRPARDPGRRPQPFPSNGYAPDPPGRP